MNVNVYLAKRNDLDFVLSQYGTKEYNNFINLTIDCNKLKLSFTNINL